MFDYFQGVSNALTTYLVAAIAIVSAESIMFSLGAAALAVRLIYDSVKLVRYIRDPDHQGG